MKIARGCTWGKFACIPCLLEKQLIDLRADVRFEWQRIWI